MKKIISLNIVLLVVGLLTLMTALLLVVTSYSIISVVLTAAFVAWTATIPFLIHWNDRVEARWRG
ncbi:MAG: hypothetical protein F4X44_11050 [Gammaproteobacteria bacterium]|nr:hypothetical protein [Gammaproteobacteria bacterium]MYD81134.1 hypothetical protein [Gammaproteobacteria bacterium]